MSASTRSEVSELRERAVAIFGQGVKAADPYEAVTRCLSVNDENLNIALDFNNSEQTRTGRWRKVRPIAFGKAACAMAKAVRESLSEQMLTLPGIAVTNYENVTEVPGFQVLGAAHPLPDEAGLAAARRLAESAQAAEQDELVLVLVSGGGSALIPYPRPPITLGEKIAVTQLLLSCGASIDQINCVRKHLSVLKGGGLARMAATADLHALILSDVLGDKISAIASGPTVPDESTFAEAVSILRTHGVWENAPRNIRELLTQGAGGGIEETPKPGDPLFSKTGYTLIGSNAISVAAITDAARQQGFQTRIYSDRLCGEARIEASKWALFAKQLTDSGFDRPLAVLAGGETTVTLQGEGRGGRNQEMALAFALAAERYDLQGNWVFLSGGTDGRDGPTDAAGALVDPLTLTRMRAAGIDPAARLDNNDSYPALASSQDLLETGATGTNVADLQILLLTP